MYILIGPCFTQLCEDMKNAYAPYCRNHDEVIAVLEKVNIVKYKPMCGKTLIVVFLQWLKLFILDIVQYASYLLQVLLN